MPVIGVTGSLGSGKTMVAGMFRKRGALVIDADKVIHDLLKGNGSAVKEVIRVFGPDVRSVKGIDRSKLAKVVFDDAKRLKKLMDILHPLAKRETEKRIRLNKRYQCIVLDVPLLIESGWSSIVDKVVVVKAAREQQIKRVADRSGMTRTEALKRLKQQMPLKEKIKHADYVVDNSGARRDTDMQVKIIYDDIRKLINNWGKV